MTGFEPGSIDVGGDQYTYQLYQNHCPLPSGFLRCVSVCQEGFFALSQAERDKLYATACPYCTSPIEQSIVIIKRIYEAIF